MQLLLVYYTVTDYLQNGFSVEFLYKHFCFHLPDIVITQKQYSIPLKMENISDLVWAKQKYACYWPARVSPNYK